MKSYSRIVSRLCFYAIPFVCIVSWWFLAFRPDPVSLDVKNNHRRVCKEVPQVLKYLSSLQRHHLHQALSGDFEMMIKLITDWDHDAEIMEELGIQNIKRFSRIDFLRCQLLSRQIKSPSEELNNLHETFRAAAIHDDNGRIFDLSQPYNNYLPQSYIAASFLLALCKPESIVALPKGLREQKNIYPASITELISLNCDRYHTEKLYKARPEIAFVADYSDPATLDALNAQEIPLFTIKHMTSIEEVQQSLIRIGHVINCPLEAELMNYFMEAALQAIDNRFRIVNTKIFTNESPKILFLKHYINFSTPTSNTLTGKLLKRIGVKDLIGDQLAQSTLAWTISMDQEQILKFDPDYIILATNSSNDTKEIIDPLLSKLTFLENKQVIFVDEEIQETPSQYLVLAYFDLFDALSPTYVQ